MRFFKARVKVNAGKMRVETANGRHYTVIPVIPVIQSVMNGSLVLASEFGKHPMGWAGIPITINHPTDENGMYVSANDPAIPSFGFMYRPQIQGERMAAEVWLDEVQAEMDADAAGVLSLARAGKTFEVSLGWFADHEEADGEYNGDQYWSITRNFVPDHLAILPNEAGACSREDGCGLNVNKEEEGAGGEKDGEEPNPTNEAEPETADPKNVDNDPKPCGCEVDNNTSLGGGSPQQQGLDTNGGTNPMNREATIKALLGTDGFYLNAEMLEQLDDSAVQDLYARFVTNSQQEGEPEGQENEPEATTQQEEGHDEDEPEAEDEPDVNTGGDAATNALILREIRSIGTRLGKAEKQLSNITANQQTAEANERQGYISAITANSASLFTADDLKLLSTERLRELAAKSQPATPPTAYMPTYVPQVHQQGGDIQEFSLDWADNGKEGK